MKKGSMLIETLVIIMIIPVIMMLLAKLYSTLLTESPRLWKNVQQNATMLNMLSQMQRDIDKAEDFPQSDGKFISNDTVLLIKQANTLIGYELGNGQIKRKVLSDIQSDNNEPRIWQIPDAKVEWKVLRKGGSGYAVEIKNSIENQKGKRIEHKLANSHLYFTGAL